MLQILSLKIIYLLMYDYISGQTADRKSLRIYLSCSGISIQREKYLVAICSVRYLGTIKLNWTLFAKLITARFKSIYCLTDVVMARKMVILLPAILAAFTIGILGLLL